MTMARRFTAGVATGILIVGLAGVVIAATHTSSTSAASPSGTATASQNRALQGKEQTTNQRISRDKAESDKIAAEQLHPVKVIAIDLAKQNLDKWIKGDYPQQLHDLEGQIQIAESTVLQQVDRTAWSSPDCTSASRFSMLKPS